MAQVLIVQNASHEGPGLLTEVFDEAKISWKVCDLQRGDSFPSIDNYQAVIVLGGPDSANDITRKMGLQIQRVHDCLQKKVPFLGICLGLQILVRAGGGQVISANEKEIGFCHADGQPFEVLLTSEGLREPLFDGVSGKFPVFQLHGETVVPTPEMTLLGTDRFKQYQILRVGDCAFGFQCHFELTREMLMSWCDLDEDLRKGDLECYLSDWNNLEEVYTQTGKHLIRRFLCLAGLLRSPSGFSA